MDLIRYNKKKNFYNLLLLIFSVTVTLVIAEITFRALLFSEIKFMERWRKPLYYTGATYDKYEVFYTEDYWKLNYLFNKKFNNRNPHPLLGWIGKFDYNLIHYEENKIGKKRPVLLFGDSFAMCIDSVVCYEEYLNNDSAFAKNHYMLNFGVGGYGLDQSYLLFDETAKKFDNPFIIFSLLTVDMDRSLLYVRDAQKPFFSIENDELILKGTPITMASEEYFKSNPPQIGSYLWNKFYMSALNPFKPKHINVEDDYLNKIKRLNRLILENLFKKLKGMNADFLVLIFQPEHHSIDDWRLIFLQYLCSKNDVPFIVDADIKEKDSKYFEESKAKYNIFGDGHPTSYLNKLIADELKEYILNPEIIDSLSISNKNLKNKYVNYYKNLILSTPEWLQDLKGKALTRGISLDSMITLDAIYVAENHFNQVQN